jgi:hypothetical protein
MDPFKKEYSQLIITNIIYVHKSGPFQYHRFQFSLGSTHWFAANLFLSHMRPFQGHVISLFYTAPIGSLLVPVVVLPSPYQ